MAAVPAALCWTLLLVFVFVSAEQKIIITADPGENVTLPCRAPNSNKITVAEWSRYDLGSEDVLFYHKGHFAPNKQHPSFGNRMELLDRQMKRGDASLTLKDVTTADSGTYKCRVFIRETRSWELSSIIITLRVLPPPGPAGGTTEDGSAELAVISVLFLLLVALLGFLIYKIPPKPKKL